MTHVAMHGATLGDIFGADEQTNATSEQSATRTRANRKTTWTTS